MVYWTAPFPMTLNDPYPQFRGRAILWRWTSQKRYEIQTKFQWNTNRDSTMLLRMILSDLRWLSKIFNDIKRRAISLRQLSFLFDHPRTTNFETEWCKCMTGWFHAIDRAQRQQGASLKSWSRNALDQSRHLQEHSRSFSNSFDPRAVS